MRGQGHCSWPTLSRAIDVGPRQQQAQGYWHLEMAGWEVAGRRAVVIYSGVAAWGL